MAGLRDYHRPLMAGIKIDSKYGKPHNVRHIEGGTLTGLTTPIRDSKPMLVTCLHVMAGETDSGDFRNPGRDEMMFQGGSAWDKKVGELADYVPISFTKPNTVDVAMCEMDIGVKAETKLHDSFHSDRIIVSKTVAPKKHLPVVAVGQVSGERTGTINALNQRIDTGGATFDGVMQIMLNSSMAEGDSGSPVLYKLGEGKYRMVGILFAFNPVYPNIGYAFRASLAEQELGIKFGNRPPVADAGPDQGVQVGKLVTLDGSRSRDPNADRLTYYWEQLFGSEHAAISEKGITLSDNTAELPQFIAPTEPRLLKFKLTVTDPYGETDSDTVVIHVHRPPVANAGPDQTVEPGSTVSLNASASSDPDGHDLEFEWEQQAGPTVSLSSTTVAEPTFTAPSVETTMTFRVTVTDIHDATDSDTVTIRTAPETWGEWSRTGNYEGCGPDRQAEESRTSNYQNTETRFVADPEPKTWSEWMDTGEDRGCGSGREAEQSRISHCGDSETRWVSDPEDDPWGPWTDTGDYSGCGPNRRKEQERTSKCGRSDSQWVAAPESDPWGSWTNTNKYQGCGPDRRRKQTRTSKCGRSDSQWVDSPVDEVWGEWEDTGEVSGILDARSKKQKRTSNCNNTEYRWVPVMTEWGPWERTGDYQGCGPDREAKEERISNFGDVDVQWVPAPEADPPGPWSDTGNHRGCGPDREKEQTRTYKCGRTETQWIAAAEALVWGEWKNLNEYRISPDDELIRQRKQERTDQCGNKETRWVYYEPVDQSPVWSVWSDTGKTRGATPCVQEKEQQRTSDQGETQTRWVDDAQPETWGDWTFTGEYRENPDTFIPESEQKRTSNCGNVEYRWVEQ